MVTIRVCCERPFHFTPQFHIQHLLDLIISSSFEPTAINIQMPSNKHIHISSTLRSPVLFSMQCALIALGFSLAQTTEFLCVMPHNYV